MEPDLVMRRELDRLLHHVAHADDPMLPSHVYVPLILDLQESIMLAAAQFLHAPEHEEEAPTKLCQPAKEESWVPLFWGGKLRGPRPFCARNVTWRLEVWTP